MTVTGITLNSLTYTVAGAGDQYVYYGGRRPMRYTGATNVAYAGATDIATVTAPDGATVVLSYEELSDELILGGQTLASFLAIIFIALALKSEGTIQEKMTYIAVVTALYMVVVYWIQLLGW